MKSHYSIERREQIGNIKRGKLLTTETIEKIRKKAFTRITPPYTEQAILNMKKKI